MGDFNDWLREHDAALVADQSARHRVVAIARLFVEHGPSWAADLAEAVRDQKAAADRYYESAKAKALSTEAA